MVCVLAYRAVYQSIDDGVALAALGEAAGWPDPAPADGSVVVLGARRDNTFNGYTEWYGFRAPAELIDRVRGPIERGRGRRTDGWAGLGGRPGWFGPANPDAADLFVIEHGGQYQYHFAFSRTEGLIYLLRRSM